MSSRSIPSNGSTAIPSSPRGALGLRRTSRRSGSRARGRPAPAAGGRPSSRCRGRPPSRRRPARRRPRRRAASRRPRSRRHLIRSAALAALSRLVRLRAMAGDEQPLRRGRRARRQHDPHAVDRRDPAGELGPPGDADGACPGRLRPLAAIPALRPRPADLAQPRPLRALRRARLDAALRAASPRRGAGPSTPTTRSRGANRSRLDDIKSFRQLDSKARRPPGVPLDLRGRDDHRAARPGGRDVGRDGDRLEVAGGALQPPRLRAVRLRHLRDRRRRLPDGGRLARGGVVRGPPAARQPLLDLRQQPHHDRRPHRDHL